MQKKYFCPFESLYEICLDFGMIDTTNKIISNLELALQRVSLWKKGNQRIVFTNGCFDILHLGHIDYLEKAKNLGDKLIVAANSDASVKLLKGESRPINPLYARMRLLAALACTDAIIFFEEETPIQLITNILPDILVKGGDYEVEKIVGYEAVTKNGGKVLTLPFVEGFSTTNTLYQLQEKR
ncbi:MAG: D-glycero-beta-D-manno-heptose 1-phosphate adenylyltransferase [Bacteroidia bacterium]